MQSTVTCMHSNIDTKCQYIEINCILAVSEYSTLFGNISQETINRGLNFKQPEEQKVHETI